MGVFTISQNASLNDNTLTYMGTNFDIGDPTSIELPIHIAQQYTDSITISMTGTIVLPAETASLFYLNDKIDDYDGVISITGSSTVITSDTSPFNSFKGLIDNTQNAIIVNISGVDMRPNSNTTLSNQCGWICATNTGIISKCSNTGYVGNASASAFLGGIACFNRSTIEYCYNTGTTSTSNNYIQGCGGIVCQNMSGATIRYCYNTGAMLYSMSSNGAGICFQGDSNSTITCCYNTATVSLYGAGICANNSGYVSYCYNTGHINNGGSGIVRSIDDGGVIYSYNFGVGAGGASSICETAIEPELITYCYDATDTAMNDMIYEFDNSMVDASWHAANANSILNHAEDTKWIDISEWTESTNVPYLLNFTKYIRDPNSAITSWYNNTDYIVPGINLGSDFDNTVEYFMNPLSENMSINESGVGSVNVRGYDNEQQTVFFRSLAICNFDDGNYPYDFSTFALLITQSQVCYYVGKYIVSSDGHIIPFNKITTMLLVDTTLHTIPPG